MNDKKLLCDEELEQITGGMNFAEIPDPASIQTEEEARKIAEMLEKDKDMGTWKTMSGEEFMQWWRSAHETQAPQKL